MSDASRWIRAVRCADLPRREGRSVRLGKHDIAIFNLGDRFLSVANRCPHKGGPLSEGIVCGATVVCPLHAWKIALETGAILSPADNQSCVETYRTRVQDGVISLELPAELTPPGEIPVGRIENVEPAPDANQTLLPMNDPDDMYVNASTEV